MALSSAWALRLYRYRTLLLRHWWILALTIGLGLAYEAYVVFTTPQLFRSVSRLNIRDELISDMKAGFTDSGSGNFFGDSVEQMKSPLVFNAAANELKLKAPQLRGDVEINADIAPRSNMFIVTGTGTNPEYTQRFVDELVRQFFDQRVASRSSTSKVVMDANQEQINLAKAELIEKTVKMRQFMEGNNMMFWNEQGKSAALYLSGLKNRYANLQDELNRLENLTPEQLLNSRPNSVAPPKATGGSSGSPASAPGAGFSNVIYEQYQQVQQQLVQRKADYAEWSKVWKPKHPKLQAIQADLDRLGRTLDTLEEQSKTATASNIVAIKAELKSLEASIEGWNQKVLEASRKDAEYQVYQSDVARVQSQLEKLQANLTSIQNGTQTSPDNWLILQNATPASEVPRDSTKHLLMGLMGGVFVGLAILFLLDRADDRISSSSEMLEHFSEPILGQIPNVSESRGESGLPLLDAEDERYTYAEAFRSLRSSLIFMPNQSDLKTILVTSAIPNEGKSTLASNLAVTMAAAGARVLLVDADLRRGDITQLFLLQGELGLSSILRGEVAWQSTVLKTKYPTLSIIPRGPVTNQSGELLLKPVMVSLLEEFKNSYDLTIFNTAPILATDDTPTLAPNFDGALMVVRAQFTSARLTQNALNALYQRQVNVLGLILNCVNTDMPDYYYYRYPKYYAA